MTFVTTLNETRKHSSAESALFIRFLNRLCKTEAAILAECAGGLRLAVLLALWTAQRQGDILRLPWSAWDGRSLTFRQSKTRTALRIPDPGLVSSAAAEHDPHVNITVYGAGAAPVLTLSNYLLNTVYYAAKSEIRITASPLVAVVPDYSVMILQPSATNGIDYEITVHRPDSPDYAAWVAACNQTMPSGGKGPRKFGWF